jgi:sulfur-oxidizing protein SoxZ
MSTDPTPAPSALPGDLAHDGGGTGDAKILLPDEIRRDSMIHVRALLSHPMDTGFFRTPEGKPIPAYFVDEVSVAYGDEEVAHFQWTSGISRDPYVAFTLKATREAPLTITWKDNKGGVFRQTAQIRFT